MERELLSRLQVRPCHIFLGAIPIFGERTFTQKCVLIEWSHGFIQNQDQSATRRFDLDRFEQMDVSFVVNYGFNSLDHIGSIWRVFYQDSASSWHRHNGFTISRKRRGHHPASTRNLGAPFVGCIVVLCRLRIWDFQVTTDFNDKKIVDLFVPRN